MKLHCSHGIHVKDTCDMCELNRLKELRTSTVHHLSRINERIEALLRDTSRQSVCRLIESLRTMQGDGPLAALPTELELKAADALESLHDELLQIHGILMRAGECPPHSPGDTITVRILKTVLRLPAPKGWRIVPERPDEHMLDAAFEAHDMPDDEEEAVYRAEFERTYRAMVGAAPSNESANSHPGEFRYAPEGENQRHKELKQAIREMEESTDRLYKRVAGSAYRDAVDRTVEHGDLSGSHPGDEDHCPQCGRFILNSSDHICRDSD